MKTGTLPTAAQLVAEGRDHQSPSSYVLARLEIPPLSDCGWQATTLWPAG